jgi:GNAT superfamily N-acetyltransferase
MFWRVPRKQWDAQRGDGNKTALRKIVTAGGWAPGILAYAGRQPVGWCAIAPRKQYVALERSRILKPIDDQPVWSISCLFVKRTHRRLGVSALLLKAAVEYAARQGATIVEGYPVEPATAKMPDPFLWHGVPSAFKAAGFHEVLRRSQTRPIMRVLIKNNLR